MNYKLKVDYDKALKILNENGYLDNSWGTNRPIIDYDGVCEAIKTFDDNVAVDILIESHTNRVKIDVYRFEGSPYMHKRVSGVRAYKQYIEEISDIWR